jgi:putative oxidoreductase
LRAKERINMNTLNSIGPLLGRVLIALIYLLSGFGKITGFESTVGYIASKNLPLPQVAAIGAIIVELGGGMLVVVGWKARWAAAALFVFTALAALLFHNFWAVPAAEAPNQTTHFLKNVCILGGLLYVAIHGSGPLSIEGITAARSVVMTRTAPKSSP